MPYSCCTPTRFCAVPPRVAQTLQFLLSITTSPDASNDVEVWTGGRPPTRIDVLVAGEKFGAVTELLTVRDRDRVLLCFVACLFVLLLHSFTLQQ